MRGARLYVIATLALAGCAAAGGWAKPGADAAAAAHEYQDCRELADSTVRPEFDIDQDILATRQNDWQRTHIGLVEADAMRQGTRGRAATIVQSCMQAKGFAPVR